MRKKDLRRNRHDINGKNKRYRAKAAFEIFKLLGGAHCKCCGSVDNLQIDHVDGRPYDERKMKHGNKSVLKGRVYKNPSGFQVLCGDCNRWKDNGPCCPCKWWDTVSSDWRTKNALRQLATSSKELAEPERTLFDD